MVWNKPDVENSVPLWIIILAVLVGLLLLALLIYILYKVSAALKENTQTISRSAEHLPVKRVQTQTL